MGIFSRISDIISANFNEMLDEQEDPEKLLKQAIREMETAIVQAKRDVAKSMASDKLLQKELAENKSHVDTWTRRATQAVEAGDDELARKALKRKKDYEKIRDALEDQAAASADAVKTLRRQLDGMVAKLSEAERRMGTLTARNRAAEIRAKAAKQSANAVTDLETDAFDKFDRLTRKVEMAEAEAEAMAELAGDPTEQEFEKIESVDDDVEDELSKLKRELGEGE